MTTMDIKTKQMWILKLLNHIMQPCMYKEIVDIGKNFKIEDCTDCYVVIIDHVFIIILSSSSSSASNDLNVK